MDTCKTIQKSRSAAASLAMMRSAPNCRCYLCKPYAMLCWLVLCYAVLCSDSSLYYAVTEVLLYVSAAVKVNLAPNHKMYKHSIKQYNDPWNYILKNVYNQRSAAASSTMMSSSPNCRCHLCKPYAMLCWIMLCYAMLCSDSSMFFYRY